MSKLIISLLTLLISSFASAEVDYFKVQKCTFNPRFEPSFSLPETNESALDQYIPNDPLFASQWGLKNTQSNFDIGITKAWQKGRGSKEIAIVVIDSGIDYTHPDLAKNMWHNPGEIPGNNIDDDQNGYVDDVHGINAINNTGNPMDDNGHGTFMAGIIGAEADNNIGIAGVMHEVSLIACKFLDERGTGQVENAVKCLDYVADLAQRDIGVRIVATQNSWGGNIASDALYKAIKRHRDLGILFVTSSGSSATNLEENSVYPASLDLSNIIVVAKANKNGELSSFSNFGPNTVHLAAPGEGILSTALNASYAVWNGSPSAAFVTGALGLMKSINSDLSWAQLKYQLLKNTIDLPAPLDAQRLISGGFLSVRGI